MKTKQKLFLLLLIVVMVSACRKDNDNGAYSYNETDGFDVKELPFDGGQIAMIDELI